MAENKVQFGVSNLHFGTYEVSDAGVVTLGAPFHLPGTTQITLDAESDKSFRTRCAREKSPRFGVEPR